MKKIYLLTLFYLSFNAFSQEKAPKTLIYLITGSTIPGKLVSANDEVIEIATENGIRTYKRTNVLLAFNESGRYIAVENISGNTDEAKNELITFYNKTTPLTNDIIIKSVPITIIPCIIAYTKESVNFKTLDGKLGSLNKDNILAIIKQNGSHELIGDITEVSPILASNTDKFEQAIESAPVTVKEQTAVQVKPTTAVVPATVVKETPPATQSPPKTVENESKAIEVASIKPKLNDSEKKEYENQSMDRIMTFKDYLNRIGDKQRSISEKQEDINNALRLFSPGATIEVTSKNKATAPRRLPIAQYLKNLSNLNYSSIQIENANVHFINNLTQAADGNYYGVVRAVQTFKGLDANGRLIYGDTVDKNYKVKLESYKSIVSGQSEVKWQILLGNVSVSQ